MGPQTRGVATVGTLVSQILLCILSLYSVVFSVSLFCIMRIHLLVSVFFLFFLLFSTVVFTVEAHFRQCDEEDPVSYYNEKRTDDLISQINEKRSHNNEKLSGLSEPPYTCLIFFVFYNKEVQQLSYKSSVEK